MNLTEKKSETLGKVFIKKIKLSERQKVFNIMNNENMGPEYLAPAMLSVSVVNEDGVPRMSMEEWDDFGADHYSEALELFSASMDINDLGGAKAEKK